MEATLGRVNHTMDFAYLFAAGLGGIVWLGFYLVRPDLRPLMLGMSLAGLPLALSDLFYVPQYWKPHTIGHIPVGVEGFLFSFEAAGICAAIYATVFDRAYAPALDAPRAGYWYRPRLSYQTLLPLAVPMPIAGLIAFALHTNIEWGLYAGLLIGTGLTVRARPDLAVPQILAALAFTPIYAAALLLWIRAYPEVHYWFILWRMPHWYLLGVPVTEIIFGALFAAYWTGLYPMVFKQRFVLRGRHVRQIHQAGAGSSADLDHRDRYPFTADRTRESGVE